MAKNIELEIKTAVKGNEELNKLEKTLSDIKRYEKGKPIDLSKYLIKFDAKSVNELKEKAKAAFKVVKEQAEKEARSFSFEKAVGVDDKGKSISGYSKFRNATSGFFKNVGSFFGGRGIDNSAYILRKEEEIAQNEKLFAATGNKKYLDIAKKNKGAMSASMLGADILSGVSKLMGDVSDNFKQVLGFSISIKDNFSNIASLAGQALSTATQSSMGTSLITNSKLRSQQLSLGLSDTENFAYSQASAILGVSGMEDLMYMNTQQRNVFANLMNRYSSWYSEMRSNGSLASMQQMQVEFSMFRQELALKMLNWFGNNKEAIYNVVNMGVTVLKALFDIVSAIAKGLGSLTSWTGTTSYLSDTVGTNSTTNITINATSSSGELQTQLSDWGSQISKQIALAVKG